MTSAFWVWSCSGLLGSGSAAKRELQALLQLPVPPLSRHVAQGLARGLNSTSYRCLVLPLAWHHLQEPLPTLQSLFQFCWLGLNFLAQSLEESKCPGDSRGPCGSFCSLIREQSLPPPRALRPLLPGIWASLKLSLHRA